MKPTGEGSACDPVQRLPIDMTIEIFAHLTIFDRMRLKCVSRRWRDHLLEPHLWTNVNLSTLITELPLDQRETTAPSPWSRVPQSRLVETKDIKVLYMASVDDHQSNKQPSKTTQLCRYLEKAAENLGCRYIDNNPTTNRWGSSYYLSSLHLVDCLLDHQYGSASSRDTGFGSLRNLRHLKLESCQNYLRGGLPPTLETLLVYGGCIGGVGADDGDLDTPLNDWKLSKLDKIRTVDITMHSLTNEDISRIVGNRPVPESLQNLTFYAQSYDDYCLIDYLKYCRLKNFTVHGGSFLCLEYMFDALDATNDSLRSFTCHSVIDACNLESFRSILLKIEEYSNYHIEQVYFLDCPCPAKDRQRVQDLARRMDICLEFRDGGYIEGPPFYVR